MGWMRTLLLGDVGNRLDIGDNEENIRALRAAQVRSASRLANKDAKISALRDELGRQKLAIEALTRFLITKKLIDESELENFITEVDAEDGVIDGRLAYNGATGKLRLVIPEDEAP